MNKQECILGKNPNSNLLKGRAMCIFTLLMILSCAPITAKPGQDL